MRARLRSGDETDPGGADAGQGVVSCDDDERHAEDEEQIGHREFKALLLGLSVTPGHMQFAASHPIAPGRQTVAARAALERRTVHIRDVSADTEYSYGAREFAPHGSLLGVPMLRGDELLGTIVLIMGEVRPFTDKQIELVTTFADQAVIAIENMRLFDEVQKRTDDLANRCSSRPPPPTCSRSSAARPSICKPCSTRWSRSAARLCEADMASSTGSTAKPTSTWQTTATRRTFVKFMETHPVKIGSRDGDRANHPGRKAGANSRRVGRSGVRFTRA